MKLLYDFFPVLLFFIAYKAFDIYVATAVAIASGFLQVGLYWLRQRRFERTHLITLGLLIVFGGATLLLRDPVFIKWKPTVLNWLFALVFLFSQFVGRRTVVERMMSHAIRVPAAIWLRLNMAWALFFAITGVINLYVAYAFDEATWVNFKLFGLMGMTVVFVFAQALYLSRHMETGQQANRER
jgi:intracellular septation protein